MIHHFKEEMVPIEYNEVATRKFNSGTEILSGPEGSLCLKK